jgi:hypothetical protein
MNSEHRKALIKSISTPRISRYILSAKGDELKAIDLYRWNAELSQALYIYLQAWEICFRNKVNNFLIWRYRANWPYDQTRLVRQLSWTDKSRLHKTTERQQQERKCNPAPLSAIVADLSLGFWVSQLSAHYDSHHVWKHNIKRIFPNENALERRSAWTISDELLRLRNRIAHHEPIFHLNLEQHHRDIQRMTAAMCEATHQFAEASCTFQTVFKARP